VKKRYPRTRQHTLRLVSRQPLRVKYKTLSCEYPDRIEAWAQAILEEHGFGAWDDFLDLLEYKSGDPILQDIAYCRYHAHDAVSALAAIPEPYLGRALRACVDMFQVGKRHESFDEHQKHAAAIHSRKASNKNLKQAQELPEERYDWERPKHSKHASLAAALGMTERGLTQWEKRHKRRWSRSASS